MSTTLFHGGTIIVDPRDTTAAPTRALAITNERIVALGDAALELAPTADTVIDLAGGTLVPALGDGHAHPVLGGLEAAGPQIRSAETLDALLATIAEWKREHPNAEWIVGASYDSTLAPNGEFDARWLDEVTGDTPTILRAWDYHTAWVNTAALAAAGITSETPDPEFGRIVRRADGSPLGTLQEAAANNFIANIAPAFTLEQRVAALESATQRYAELGMTWVQDAWVDPSDFATYLTAARQNRLHTRINLAFRADPLHWETQLEQFDAMRAEVANLAHPRLTANTIKFFIDGVIESYTAALVDPYADRPDERGLPNWSEAALNAATAAWDARGFQLHLHAIGDGANRLALNALERAANTNTARDRAHVIAHVAMLHPEDVARFAQLGVIANFEPYWAQCDAVMRDLTIPHIGHDRESWQYMIGSVLRSGATVSFGSDWPVTTQDWRPAFATAITRSDLTPGAAAWLPDERVTAQAALTSYTSSIAAQALTADRGTLTVGNIADLAWLSTDPLECDPLEIPQIQVRGTWLAGERTHTH